MANLKREVYDALIDALDKGDFSYDTDGENIWIDDEQGKTVSVSIAGCEPADDAEPQQQAAEPEADAAGETEDANVREDESDLNRYTVSINVSMGTVVEVKALDESCAEEIVNRQWANDEISLGELTLHETRIDCTGRLG